MQRRIFSLSLLLACSCTIHADPVFAPGVQRQTEMRALFDAFPKRGRGVDVTVREWVPGLGYDSNVVGLYSPSEPMITLRRFKVVGDTLLTFAHEYGHHVWFTEFTDKEREDWKAFWAYSLKRMPRDYAKENEVEGFAECFARTYYTGKPTKAWGYYDKPVDEFVQAKIKAYFVGD